MSRLSTKRAARSPPVGFEVISQTEIYIDRKTQKEKRRPAVTKNEIARRLIQQAIKNEVPFEFVLFDSWFAAAENMKFVKGENRRDFICPLKSNRKVALSTEDKLQRIIAISKNKITRILIA